MQLLIDNACKLSHVLKHIEKQVKQYTENVESDNNSKAVNTLPEPSTEKKKRRSASIHRKFFYHLMIVCIGHKFSFMQVLLDL